MRRKTAILGFVIAILVAFNLFSGALSANTDPAAYEFKEMDEANVPLVVTAMFLFGTLPQFLALLFFVGLIFILETPSTLKTVLLLINGVYYAINVIAMILMTALIVRRATMQVDQSWVSLIINLTFQQVNILTAFLIFGSGLAMRHKSLFPGWVTPFTYGIAALQLITSFVFLDSSLSAIGYALNAVFLPVWTTIIAALLLTEETSR